ncbi:MBL fold metallo-hydrolase [Anaerolineales bacterium HSG6]|nr:MBL fold metallo-hydrolase [Anaerolineales bacterium HSG6]MDM8532647.1 MBL fold metallo-hydrolase [Anaerolineales bacterium HSG25]
MTILLKFTLFSAGYCTQSEYISRRGGFRTIQFPATFALIEHPQLGLILFDTGYTPQFYQETRRFPYSLYSKATPVYVTEADTAQAKLLAQGISTNEVRYIIVSHFHADHVGGLADFPQANYIYYQPAYDAVSRRRGLSAVTKAFLPGLIPPDFVTRSRPFTSVDFHTLPAEYTPFTEGVDLFADQSLIAVKLPGHATGQIGLFLTTYDGSYFLVADACWHSQAYREDSPPHPITRLLFDSWADYCHSLHQIHMFHQNRPDVQIIPTHCGETYVTRQDV